MKYRLRYNGGFDMLLLWVAAEQKARATYENIMRLCDDPDVNDVLRFLREREIVHFQRFGESLRIVQEHLDSPGKFYMSDREYMK